MGDWMHNWWTKMLTLNVGILGATVVFVGRETGFRWLWCLWISWGFLILSLIAGSVKLWGWSAEKEAKGGDLLGPRNWVRQHLAGVRWVAALAYAFFIFGLVFLLFFGAANIKETNVQVPVEVVETVSSWQPAFLISVAALLFTIFSFWWMNWRPGRLRVGRPRCYAAIGSRSGAVLVEVPLVFFNGGATPVVVQNLRLRIEGGGKPLAFNAVVDKIGTDEGRRFATQFPVRQQEAVNLICEFQRGGGLLFEARQYLVTLEGVWGRSMRWRRLVKFELNLTEADLPSINERLIVRDNWKDGD